MRLFQNSGLYPAYRPRLAQLSRAARSYADHTAAFLSDRFGACHFLQPVLKGDDAAFFSNGDHEPSQQCWAREHGLPTRTPLDQILLAQIEHHRAEVFYNLDPMRYDSAFVRRLPGCIRHTIAWRAAPSPGADFGAYDRIVCNFPSILQSYRDRGWRAAYFAPAHDPEMDAYAARDERPVDVLFVGGYTRHHRRRAEVLEAVAHLAARHRVVYHLDRSRATRLGESPLGRLLPLAAHQRPAAIRRVSAEPVFGRDLYAALASARIVLNGAVDMAGEDRGNMRCFEAMGCGALMVSDAGRYPAGLQGGENFLTYVGAPDVSSVIERALADRDSTRAMARRGYALVSQRYSKAIQWRAFMDLVASL